MYKPFLSAALLLSAATAHSQTTYSHDSSDLAFMEDRTIMFYLDKDGRDYIKVFTCGSTVQLRADGAALLCDGGLGEPWSVYFTDATEDDDYYFIPGTSSDLPVNSVVYVIKDGADYSFSGYATHLAGGLTAFESIQVRNLDMASASNPAEVDYTDITTPIPWALDPLPIPAYNVATGFLGLPGVVVGGVSYSVVMQRMETGSGALEFRVVAAVKK